MARPSKKRVRDVIFKAFFVGIFLGVLAAVFIESARAKEELIDPSEVSAAVILRNITSRTVSVTAAEKPTFAEYKKFITQIFRNKSRIALAVFESECNHTRKEWPVCVNKWWDEKRKHGESSIGPAQINILAHGNDIPGVGKEKEIWLSNWKNNIILAYQISKGGTDFTPWTAYTSKVYLSKL